MSPGDPMLLLSRGNLAVDGEWIPAVRSFVKDAGPSREPAPRRLRTGDNFASSTLSGLILEAPGNQSPGGTFKLSGTLRVNPEAYCHDEFNDRLLSPQRVPCNFFAGDFLWNQGGTVYIDCRHRWFFPAPEVTDHTQFDGSCAISSRHL